MAALPLLYLLCFPCQSLPFPFPSQDVFTVGESSKNKRAAHLVFVVVVPVPGRVHLLVDVVVVAVVLVPIANTAAVRGRARGRVGRRVAVTRIDII